jgi:transposase
VANPARRAAHPRCLEATGAYGEALALHLHAGGHTVSVVNPAAVKAFAASRLSRTKTDKVDAELIARFCLAQQPPAWNPPAPEVRELQALARRLESLVEMRVAEESRLSSGVTAEAVRQGVEEHVAYLNEQIRRTGELIRRHVDSHPTLRQQSALLDSIPGVGEATAALLLAESRTSSSTGARGRWPPTPGWCRASGAAAARCAGGCGCPRSATPACAARSTSRPSRR